VALVAISCTNLRLIFTNFGEGDKIPFSLSSVAAALGRLSLSRKLESFKCLNWFYPPQNKYQWEATLEVAFEYLVIAELFGYLRKFERIDQDQIRRGTESGKAHFPIVMHLNAWVNWIIR